MEQIILDLCGKNSAETSCFTTFNQNSIFIFEFYSLSVKYFYVCHKYIFCEFHSVWNFYFTCSRRALQRENVSRNSFKSSYNHVALATECADHNEWPNRNTIIRRFLFRTVSLNGNYWQVIDLLFILFYLNILKTEEIFQRKRLKKLLKSFSIPMVLTSDSDHVLFTKSPERKDLLSTNGTTVNNHQRKNLKEKKRKRHTRVNRKIAEKNHEIGLHSCPRSAIEPKPQTYRLCECWFYICELNERESFCL